MREGKKILLEQYMENYHIRNQHQKKCKANPMITFRAIKELNSSDFNGNIGLLLGKLRQLVLRIIFPKRNFARSKTHHHTPSNSRRPILNFRSDSNWATLGEIPNSELVVGFIGQFWHPTPNFVNFNADPSDFKKFSKNGYAKAVLDFHDHCLYIHFLISKKMITSRSATLYLMSPSLSLFCFYTIKSQLK